MNIHLKALFLRCLILAVLAAGATPAFSQVSISIGIAPPPLEIYSQPPCPYDGYIWTPGYWAYDDGAYYWVSGQWVQPPRFGVLWTPPYWGWNGDGYRFHSGYWGSSVGYYGGVNYGYGYGGNGYGGGRWQGQRFAYNTAVNNVNRNFVQASYADRSAINTRGSRVSYNGGRGGLQAQPTAKQRQYSASQQSQTTVNQRAISNNPQVTQEKRTAGIPQDRQARAVTKTPQTLPAPRTFENRSQAVKPAKTQAQTYQPRSSAVAKPQTQSRPAAQAKPQSRPATQAKPQSRPAAQAQPQTRAPQQQGQGQSQGRSDHAEKSHSR